MSRTQDVFGRKGGRGASGCKINVGGVSRLPLWTILVLN